MWIPLRSLQRLLHALPPLGSFRIPPEPDSPPGWPSTDLRPHPMQPKRLVERTVNRKRRRSLQMHPQDAISLQLGVLISRGVDQTFRPWWRLSALILIFPTPPTTPPPPRREVFDRLHVCLPLKKSLQFQGSIPCLSFSNSQLCASATRVVIKVTFSLQCEPNCLVYHSVKCL